MYKVVIFDMDDTLIQTKKAKYAAHIYTAKHFYNLELNSEHIDKHWGTPFHLTMKGIYGDVDTLENLITNYMSISHLFPIAQYTGADKMLQNLKNRYQIGLLTAANYQLVPMALGESGIPLSRFNYIQTSSDTPFHKPDPQVFLPTLEHFGKLGIKAQEIIYVGDAVSDAQAAIGAGIDFIGISGHTTSKTQFNEVKVPSLPNFSTLLDYLS